MSKDFTREQEERIDDVMQKVEDFFHFLCPEDFAEQNKRLPMMWSFADAISEYLTDRGFKVYFPVHITDGDHEENSDIWK